MWKIFWRSAASPSATKPSDSGVGSLVSNTPGCSGDGKGAWATPGTWNELFVTIQGQRQYLWRAVDQDGDVIDILVQPRRDQRAAERFFRKLLKGQEREPQRLVTDKLRTYEAARRILMPSVQHDTERYANNLAEVSPEPIRQRERQKCGDLGFRRDRFLVSALAIDLVGKRRYRNTLDLVRDLSNRMNLEVTVLITTDSSFTGESLSECLGQLVPTVR